MIREGGFFSGASLHIPQCLTTMTSVKICGSFGVQNSPVFLKTSGGGSLTQVLFFSYNPRIQCNLVLDKINYVPSQWEYIWELFRFGQQPELLFQGISYVRPLAKKVIKLFSILEITRSCSTLYSSALLPQCSILSVFTPLSLFLHGQSVQQSTAPDTATIAFVLLVLLLMMVMVMVMMMILFIIFLEIPAVLQLSKQLVIPMVF